MRLPLRTVRRARRLATRFIDRAYAARPRSVIRDIRRSGLFDKQWYAEQLENGIPQGIDPIEHYVKTGPDVSPNPCILNDWYKQQHPDTPRKLVVPPFIHYVTRGAARGLSPHPFFDVKEYLARMPSAKDHPGGPLGHYLDKGWQLVGPSKEFDSSAYEERNGQIEGPPFVHLARNVGRLLRHTRGYEHLPRTSTEFDLAAANVFKKRVIADFVRSGQSPPLVSIVIPTKDRAAGVVQAVRSVISQTYPHWQLLVVDDGGTDDTAEALRPFLSDMRIRLIRRERSGGVSAARNTGLAHARGDYVAYLDSDNTWTPEFLEVMVAFVCTRLVRFAYAVSELREDKKNGRRSYRALPFHREALSERNFIDCIVVLHERSLLSEVGTFDENLRRNVDWDLFIRMARVTDFELVPFIATQYDAWEQRSDRITVNEPMGYRYAVLAKSMIDWDDATRRLTARRSGRVSIIMNGAGAGADIIKAVEQVLRVTDGDLEVVLVDGRLSDGEATRLQYLQAIYPQVRTMRYDRVISVELARNLGAIASTGEFLVFLTGDTLVESGWLEPLIRPVADRTAAATQPLVLLPDGTVWSAGFAFARDAVPHGIFRRFAGDAPEVVEPSVRAAVSGTAFAARAEDFVEVHGFDPLYVNDLDSPDLGLRLAEATRLPLAYVPTSVVSLLQVPTRPSGASSMASSVHNEELFAARWRGELAADADEIWGRSGLAIVGYDAQAPTHRGFDPIVIHDRERRPLRWAIKIGAPTVARRTNWGDWHFALALKASLERFGQEVVIDCKDAWYRPTSHLDDVTLVLRGVTVYTTNPQQINLLWVISHPERVTTREAARYDGVFSASPILSRRFSAELGRPVETLLQCTDHTRFRPVPPDSRRRHEVLFVGNARGIRHSVRTALDAGIVPAVYGLRWDRLLPDGAWRGDYIPNDQLAATYVAAGAVLNDHWDDMKREGLLSNRLFDLAACGARIISDPVPGLQDVFGVSVLTFETPADLAMAVATHLEESPERRNARVELSDRTRREHSFDSRAESLVEAVRKLQADRGWTRVKYEA